MSDYGSASDSLIANLNVSGMFDWDGTAHSDEAGEVEGPSLRVSTPRRVISNSEFQESDITDSDLGALFLSESSQLSSSHIPSILDGTASNQCTEEFSNTVLESVGDLAINTKNNVEGRISDIRAEIDEIDLELDQLLSMNNSSNPIVIELDGHEIQVPSPRIDDAVRQQYIPVKPSEKFTPCNSNLSIPMSSPNSDFVASSRIRVAAEYVAEPTLPAKPIWTDINEWVCESAKLLFGKKQLPTVVDAKLGMISEWLELFRRRVSELENKVEYRRKIKVQLTSQRAPKDLIKNKGFQEWIWKFVGDLDLRSVFSCDALIPVVKEIRHHVSDVIVAHLEFEIGKLFLHIGLLSDGILCTRIPATQKADGYGDIIDARTFVLTKWKQLKQKGLAVDVGLFNWPEIGLVSESHLHDVIAAKQAADRNIQTVLKEISVDDIGITYGYWSKPDTVCSSTQVENKDWFGLEKSRFITSRYRVFRLGPDGEMLNFKPKNGVFESVQQLTDREFVILKNFPRKAHVPLHALYSAAVKAKKLRYKRIDKASVKRHIVNDEPPEWTDITDSQTLIAKKRCTDQLQHEASVEKAQSVAKKNRKLSATELERMREMQRKQLQEQLQKLSVSNKEPGTSNQEPLAWPAELVLSLSEELGLLEDPSTSGTRSRKTAGNPSVRGKW